MITKRQPEIFLMLIVSSHLLNQSNPAKQNMGNRIVRASINEIECIFSDCTCTEKYLYGQLNIQCNSAKKLEEFSLRIYSTHHRPSPEMDIDMSFNLLTQVPADRFQNLRIEKLYLQNNKIDHLHLDSFRLVKQLHRLNLANNLLSELNATTLDPLRDLLRYLDFIGNKIETIDEQTFANFSSQ